MCIERLETNSKIIAIKELNIHRYKWQQLRKSYSVLIITLTQNFKEIMLNSNQVFCI